MATVNVRSRALREIKALRVWCARLVYSLACLVLGVFLLAGQAQAQFVGGITPNTGTTAGGTNVTITGAGFTGATGVTIGGVAVTNLVVVNNTTITATTGARAAGVVDVVVILPGDQGTGVGLFTYTAPPAPTIINVNPNTGPPAGGNTVQIFGTNFTGATAVMFGGAPAAAFAVANDGAINATAPPGAVGAVNVTVTTPAGTSAQAATYTYAVPTPAVNFVNPNSGSTAGGTQVTITGLNFSGATAVGFGGVAAASFTVETDNRIVAVTPPRAAGVVNVTVTTAGGTGTGINLYSFVITPPNIAFVTPNVGPTDGGTVVTISGTNFTGATAVTFGGVAATSFVVNSSTSITATTPAGGAGPRDVSVTTPSGTGTGVGFFIYNAPALPTVTTVTPNRGTIAGGTPVTITGTNFTGVTAVTIGGVAVSSFVVVNATTITAVTGARAAATVDVVVTTGAGAATGASLYTYSAATAPTAANATLSVPFASPGTQINLGALVTGAFTTVAIATQPTRGTLALSGATATYVPNRNYSGPDSFTFTAAGAGGTSQPGTISITVGARPNPANDPTVNVLIQNQILVSDRFASTQISNINTHLEGQHCDDNEPGNRCQEETVNLGGLTGAPGAPQGAALGFADLQKPFQPSAFGMLLRDKGFVSAFSGTNANMRAPSNMPFSIWAAGSVQFGSKNWDGTPSNRFSTSGVTVGVDKRFAPGFRAGVAFGLGTDRLRIGQDGTRVEATAVSASIYATYMIMPKTFLDAIVGYAGAGFDTRRYVTAGSQFVSGNRDGAILFGSATLMREERYGGLKFAPYLRLDIKHIMLNGFQETGSDIWALSYDKLETTRVSGAAGLRMTYPITMSWGVLTPMLRLEYANVFSGSYNQTLRYADQIGGTVYTLTGATPGRNAFSAALGLKAMTDRNLTADLEYQFTGGSGVTSHSMRGAVRFGF